VLLPVPDTVALWLGVWLLLPVPVGVTLGLAPALRVEAAEGDWVALRLLLLEVEAVAVPEPDGVQVLDPVGLTVIVGELLVDPLLLLVMLAVPLLEAVLLGEAPEDREAVGLTELDKGGVPLALTVLLPLWVAEAVPLPVELLLPVPLSVGVGDKVAGGVALPLRELLPLVEAEAPAVREAVGELDRVEEPERVEEGVGCAVPVPELEELLVGVPELVGLEEQVPDPL